MAKTSFSMKLQPIIFHWVTGKHHPLIFFAALTIFTFDVSNYLWLCLIIHSIMWVMFMHEQSTICILNNWKRFKQGNSKISRRLIWNLFWLVPDSIQVNRFLAEWDDSSSTSLGHVKVRITLVLIHDLVMKWSLFDLGIPTIGLSPTKTIWYIEFFVPPICM